jgi:hypothetical protein
MILLVTFKSLLETVTIVIEFASILQYCIKLLKSPLSLIPENKFAVGSGAKTVCVCYYEQENNW